MAVSDVVGDFKEECIELTSLAKLGTPESKAYFAAKKERRKERLRPQLKRIRISLLSFLFTDKLFCTIGIIGTIYYFVQYVLSKNVEEILLNWSDKLSAADMKTKEQFFVVGVTAWFLLMRFVHTLIFIGYFNRAIIQKNLYYLGWQRTFDMLMLLAKIGLIIIWYMYFDYNSDAIILSMLPLTYHCVALCHLIMYISEIELSVELVTPPKLMTF